MARVLISGYYGFDNLGDELLLAALLRELEQALAEGILARLWGPRPDDGPQIARLARRLEGNRAQLRQIFTLPS